MAGKKPKGKAVDNEDIEVLDPALEVDSENSLVVDDFDELFGDGSENVRVQIYRFEPKYHDGKDITGFICNLPPGSDLSSIQAEYGGGLFEIRKLVNNRFSKRKRVRIAGAPKPEHPPGDDALIDTEPANINLSPSVSKEQVTYNGIPISGDSGEFIKMLERVTLIKAAFPDKTEEVNSNLLNLALSRDKSSIGELGQLLEFATMLKDSSGGSGGSSGSNVVDLIRDAISGFKDYVKMAGTGQAPRAYKVQDPNAALAHVQPEPEKIAGEPVETTPVNNAQPVKEELNLNTFTHECCTIIVAAFLTEPQKTVDEAVGMLNVSMPALPDPIKEQVKTYRKSINDMADGVLAQSVELTPEESEKFSLFFNKIFDIYIGV